MKKRLITCVIAIISVVAFAQNNGAANRSPWAGIVKNTGVANKHSEWQGGGTLPDIAAPQKAATVVTPPEGLAVEDYVLYAIDIDGKKASSTLSVGFSGNEVYVQGVCHNLPEAWIKGTRSGNNISFPTGQYFGKFINFFDMYFVGYDHIAGKVTDVVFEYDEAANTMTAKQAVLINDNTDTPSYYDFYMDMSFLKVIEQAGTPATPQIDKIFISKMGNKPRLMFTIPLIDTNGNAMASSKITYKIYSDIHHTMAPVTLKKSEYTAIESDMTEIAYNYTDDQNIYTGDIDLLMDYTGWNRIGVKVTYNGGGESHESAIGWYSIEQADTLPAGVIPVEYKLSVEDVNYNNDEEKRIIKVAVDGDDVYMTGLASRFPDAWLKGKKEGEIVRFPADRYVGEFVVPGSGEVQHYYFNPGGDVEFEFNAEEMYYTADAYTVDYADETSETGLSNFDNYSDAEVTPIEEIATMPALPEINTVERNRMGDYFVTIYVYANDQYGEYILPSKLSYQLFVDKGDGVETPYVLSSLFYALDSDMTVVPYGLNTTNGTIFNEGDYHTVVFQTRDVDSWKRLGVKSIYSGGGETNETPVHWVYVNIVSGIDEVGTDVAETELYDMQGRRVNGDVKGLLIKKMRMTNGTVKTVKVMNR
ncbi:MAG: hypothetical protein SOZ80_07525 [Prevotella sp.]|uniref:hypothetical protein n=1 Tax=Prevotella sp. TaxID=59823 RepID=UPI002A3069AB|nr:hypothetical protein [Prevotella sp.]MDD7317548.1 hypothetical protein [Prevotellaceae bacterium]MDY4020605.1 hypothetical protein [Prevotella sp.]